METTAVRQSLRAGVILVALSSCTMACGAADPSLGSESSALEGGEIILGHTGVVEFSTPAGGCTGAMIAPNAVLTAAHCFKPVLGAGLTAWSGNTTGTVFYHDPDSGRQPAYSGSVTWIAYPTYDGNQSSGAGRANSDAALLVIPDRFANTNHNDYLRIYAGPNEDIDDFLRLFGTGFINDEGDDDNLLWKAVFSVEAVESAHVKVDMSTSLHLCLGDSGGPAVKDLTLAGNPISTVVGDLANMDALFDPDAPCGDSGIWLDDAFYSRTNADKVQWIEQTLGKECPDTSVNANRRYRRCFDIPYIDDVPGEGLDAPLATAIVHSVLG